ncbi:phage tail fiber protein [Salmonella enterica]
MSIPVQVPFDLYVANGSTTVFPYRFLLNQASDLRITANGKTVSSGFSVSGEGNQSGGQITFSTPPSSGTKIAILRNIPLRRDTEYQDNGDLLASTINADFDRLWMAVQGLDSENNLALSRSGQDVNYYDAEGKRVKNLADPVDPQDAANKKSLDSAVGAMGQQVQDAKTHLDVVWQSVSQNAIAAKQSETNAATSEQQAAQHAKDASDTLTKTQAAAEEAASAAATTAAEETATRLKNEFSSDADRAEAAATSAQTAATSASGSAEKAEQAAQDAKQSATTAASDAVSTAVPEAVKQVTASVALDADRAESAATKAETASTGAQEALKEAQVIAKTPGAPGKSAWEIWKDAQPAGTDTSMAAYLKFQEGKPGKDAGSSTEWLGVGSYLLAIFYNRPPQSFFQGEHHEESGSETWIKGTVSGSDVKPVSFVQGNDSVPCCMMQNFTATGTWRVLGPYTDHTAWDDDLAIHHSDPGYPTSPAPQLIVLLQRIA